MLGRVQLVADVRICFCTATYVCGGVDAALRRVPLLQWTDEVAFDTHLLDAPLPTPMDHEAPLSGPAKRRYIKSVLLPSVIKPLDFERVRNA